MGLQGTLDTLPVLDALEALARLRREGLLEVRGGGSRATLSMVDGALVGGEVDALVGSVADRDALVLPAIPGNAGPAPAFFTNPNGFDTVAVMAANNAASATTVPPHTNAGAVPPNSRPATRIRIGNAGKNTMFC